MESSYLIESSSSLSFRKLGLLKSLVEVQKCGSEIRKLGARLLLDNLNMTLQANWQILQHPLFLNRLNYLPIRSTYSSLEEN